MNTKLRLSIFIAGLLIIGISFYSINQIDASNGREASVAGNPVDDVNLQELEAVLEEDSILDTEIGTEEDDTSVLEELEEDSILDTAIDTEEDTTSASGQESAQELEEDSVLDTVINTDEDTTSGQENLQEDIDEVPEAVGDHTAGPVRLFHSNGQSFYFETDASGNLLFRPNFLSHVPTFFINDDNDRVGIGTTAPSERLEVRGNIDLADNELYLRNTAGNRYGVGYATEGAPEMVLFTDNRLDITESDTNVRVMSIVANDRRVGIGTTTPSEKLEVVGNIDLADNELYLRNNANNVYGIGYATEGASQMAIFSDDLIQFTESDTDTTIMTISGNQQRVGIGTVDPSERLEVRGNIDLADNELYLRNTAGNRYGVGYATEGAPEMVLFTDNRLDITESDTNVRVMSIVANDRRVGLGDTTPNSKLDVEGTIFANAPLVIESDGRLKKDVKPLSNALEMITKLEGVSYKWKDGGDGSRDEKTHLGFIAQEVEKIYPGLVGNDDGNKTLSYTELIAPLVEAIKELRTESNEAIAQLKAENATAKNDNVALKAENEQLKKAISVLADRQDLLEDMLIAKSTTSTNEKVVKID